MSNIEALKERVLEAEARATYAESLLEAFYTGNVPEKSSLKHVIMAQWGRKRLAEIGKTPALLVKQAT